MITIRFRITAILFLFPSLFFAQTFTGVGGPIPDDGNSVTFEIPASALPNILNATDFGVERVCINVVHQWLGDLSISLRAPDGTLIPLVTGVGGDTDGFVNTCLSSNATTSIFEVWYPFTGEFRPFGDMGQLNNGQDPNGNWQLIILDTYAFADSGDLLDWSITFGPNPCKPFPFESSDLPILKIATDGQGIVNEPKINAQFTVIDNGLGQRNYLDQTDFAYSGTIGIELRGNSSQWMPKKSYNFETRDDVGEDKDVELLRLPAGSDFVLAANFSDKTLMRNALAYETFRQLGHYATRTRFCEVVLNNTYQGVYILTEDIRRDKDRVDIAKLEPDDTTGVALTGGYICRVDWNHSPGWNSQFSQPNSPNVFTYFQHTYPRWNEHHPTQQYYIRSYIDSFEVALHGPDFQDPEAGWRKFGAENTFVDYLILNEISKNVDGYRLSTFFQKDRDDKGGKLRMGPPWDYDLAWYNADYCDNFNTSGFAFDINYICGDAGVPFWWEKLMTDTLFAQNLACRWQSLRDTNLKNTNFFGVIDSMEAVLEEAQARNFEFWPILGKYVWPNPGFLPPTYAGEVAKMKGWIYQRFAWLDFVFGQNLPNLNANFTASALNAFNWQFSATEIPGYIYAWDFGDGTFADQPSVQHEFSGTGTFEVKLTVSTPYGCSNTGDQIIHIIDVGANDALESEGFRFFPNPAQEVLNLRLPENFSGKFNLRMLNVLGETVLAKSFYQDEKQLAISVKDLQAGAYCLELQSQSRQVSTRVLIKL
ncbi:MAG: CotH kinase family protein [Saprospiraceae bacterium]